MRSSSAISLLCLLLLVSCTAAPTFTPTLVPTLPPLDLTAAPTASPLPSATFPPTWTPAPPSTPRPSPTLAQTVPSTATPSPSAALWPPGAIPAVTLTPTPADAVPPEAQRDYTAALSACAVESYSRALEYLNPALALVPEHADFLALRGRVLIALSHPLSGEADLRHALGIDPFHAPARQAMAELYAQYGRLRDAVAEYTRYLTLAPDDPAGWYALGQIKEQQSRPLEAIAAYSKTLELSPTHLDGLIRRGALWLEAGNDPAAWSDYTALIALRPSADLYQVRAEINLRLDAPLLAAADFEATLSLQPAGVPTYTLLMQLGRAYLQGGAASQAAATFSQTISLTTALEPRILLGDSYLAAGNYPAALQVFSDTIPLATPAELEPALAGRGQAYLEMGEYQAAVVDFSEALNYAQTAEERAAVLEWRSVSYTALEQYPEAIADLTAAHDLAPASIHLYQRGVLHQAAGDDEAAIADLTAFLEAAPPDETDPALLLDAQTRLDDLTAEPP